jgi:hypothetical protein
MASESRRYRSICHWGVSVLGLMSECLCPTAPKNAWRTSVVVIASCLLTHVAEYQ